MLIQEKLAVFLANYSSKKNYQKLRVINKNRHNSIILQKDFKLSVGYDRAVYNPVDRDLRDPKLRLMADIAPRDLIIELEKLKILFRKYRINLLHLHKKIDSYQKYLYFKNKLSSVSSRIDTLKSVVLRIYKKKNVSKLNSLKAITVPGTTMLSFRGWFSRSPRNKFASSTRLYRNVEVQSIPSLDENRTHKQKKTLGLTKRKLLVKGSKYDDDDIKQDYKSESAASVEDNKHDSNTKTLLISPTVLFRRTRLKTRPAYLPADIRIYRKAAVAYSPTTKRLVTSLYDSEYNIIKKTRVYYLNPRISKLKLRNSGLWWKGWINHKKQRLDNRKKAANIKTEFDAQLKRFITAPTDVKTDLKQSSMLVSKEEVKKNTATTTHFKSPSKRKHSVKNGKHFKHWSLLRSRKEFYFSTWAKTLKRNDLIKSKLSASTKYLKADIENNSNKVADADLQLGVLKNFSSLNRKFRYYKKLCNKSELIASRNEIRQKDKYIQKDVYSTLKKTNTNVFKMKNMYPFNKKFFRFKYLKVKKLRKPRARRKQRKMRVYKILPHNYYSRNKIFNINLELVNFFNSFSLRTSDSNMRINISLPLLLSNGAALNFLDNNLNDLNVTYENFFNMLILRQCKNNFFMTVVNRSGNVLFQQSAGSLFLSKRSRRSVKVTIKPLLKRLKSNLRRLAIPTRSLHYLILNSKYNNVFRKIFYTLKYDLYCAFKKILYVKKVSHANFNNYKKKKARRL